MSTINTQTDVRIQTGQQTPAPTTGTNAPVGQGTAGQTVTVPGAQSPLGGPAMSAFTTIFASAGFLPQQRGDVELLLAEASAKLKDTREDTELKSKEANQEAMRTAQQQKADKLNEQTQKIEEAIAAKAKNKIASFFGSIFKAIGAALAIAFAAIAIASGVGAGLGALLIAAAVVAVVSLTDDIVTQATGTGIAGNIAKAAGADKETMQKVQEISGYVMLGVTIALTIATLGVGLKSAIPKIAGKVADQAAKMSTKVTQEILKQALQSISKNAAKVAGQSGDEVANAAAQGAAAGAKGTAQAASAGTTTATRATQIANAANGATQVGGGASGVATAIYTNEAKQAYADATDAKGEADQLAAFMAVYQDLIDQALAMLMNAQDVSNAMLEAASSGLRDRGDSMMQVRFSG